MAQILKDQVELSIRAAAIRVFAKDGYEGATMAAVAKDAGVSTGNLYRYYRRKDILFDAVLDRGFAHTFQRLFLHQVDSACGCAEGASKELLRFSIDNRLKVVVLLGKAQGSQHAALSGELVDALVSRAMTRFRKLAPGLRMQAPERITLEQIYASFVATIARILESFEDEQQIRDGVATYARFHLAGMAALFK